MHLTQHSRIPVSVISQNYLLCGVYHLVPQSRSMVVLLHGLGGNKCGRGRFFVLLSEYLASLQIASVRFDFVGSGDSEGLFSDGNPFLFLQNTKDIISAIPHSFSCKTAASFDRIGLFGRSFGGYIASVIAPEVENLCALAIQSPPFDVAAFQEAPLHIEERGKDLFFLGEKLHADFLSQMEQLSVEKSFQKIAPKPVLHLSCEKDMIVGKNHDQKYLKTLSKNGFPFSSKILFGADHECSSLKSRSEAISLIGDFFAEQMNFPTA